MLYECYVVKVTHQNCENFTLTNVILNQDSSPVITVHILSGTFTNIVMDCCTVLGEATSFCRPTANLRGLLITNSLSNKFVIYGNDTIDKELANIRIVNCKISLMYYVEKVNIFVNCVFLGIHSSGIQLVTKTTPTRFIGCTFITDGVATWGYFEELNCDYYFSDCVVKNTASSGGIYAFLFRGSGSFEVNIFFDNIVFDDTTYGYNMFFDNSNINVRICNSKLTKASLFVVNFVQIFNTQWETAYKLLDDVRNSYNYGSFAYVYKNWVDYSPSM